MVKIFFLAIDFLCGFHRGFLWLKSDHPQRFVSINIGTVNLNLKHQAVCKCYTNVLLLHYFNN